MGEKAIFEMFKSIFGSELMVIPFYGQVQKIFLDYAKANCKTTPLNAACPVLQSVFKKYDIGFNYTSYYIQDPATGHGKYDSDFRGKMVIGGGVVVNNQEHPGVSGNAELFNNPFVINYIAEMLFQIILAGVPYDFENVGGNYPYQTSFIGPRSQQKCKETLTCPYYSTSGLIPQMYLTDLRIKFQHKKFKAMKVPRSIQFTVTSNSSRTINQVAVDLYNGQIKSFIRNAPSAFCSGVGPTVITGILGALAGITSIFVPVGAGAAASFFVSNLGAGIGAGTGVGIDIFCAGVETATDFPEMDTVTIPSNPDVVSRNIFFN